MTSNDPPPTGDAMRRKVRKATAGVVGAAVLASALATAGLAYAAGTDERGTTDAVGTSSTTDDSASSEEDLVGDREDGAAAAPPSTTALSAPTQAPAAGTGRRHATSGGS